MSVDMNKVLDLTGTKEVIDTKGACIAPVESTSTASRAYAVGKRFWYAGKLYIATADIASGGAITPGTNCRLDVLGDDVSELRSAVESISNPKNKLDDYLYKKNIYIDNQGVEKSLAGYNVYKIPVTTGDLVCLEQTEGTKFWDGINASYVFKFQNSDNSYTALGVQLSLPYNYCSNSGAFNTFAVPSDVVYVIITSADAYSKYVSVYKNPLTKLAEIKGNIVKDTETVLTVDNNFFSCDVHRRVDELFVKLTSPGYAHIFKIKQNDVLKFNTLLSGFSSYGTFTPLDLLNTVPIDDKEYTAPSDGFVCVFDRTDSDFNCTYYPKDAIKIDEKNVIGINNFDGVDGVAFGTSLTYRAISSHGYLTTLSRLSGITFDNQGVGSSTILGDGGSLDMLAKIKSYESYSNKKVCIIEGFVNDWYYNGENLGEPTDDTETTVCGCLRSAINFLFSENASISLFVILDHYGRNYNDVDCSTTAENSNGDTQYVFYETLAKVCESLGVPVIKEYAVSQISENTPQYLADNIHCNALGAIQSGYTIWSLMKQYYLNQVS